MMGLDQRRVKVFFGLPTLGSIQIELRSFVRKTSHPYGTRITTPTEYITLAENYKGGHQGFALIPPGEYGGGTLLLLAGVKPPREGVDVLRLTAFP